MQLLNRVHEALEPGGRAIIGNFVPGHGVTDFAEHALEWSLIYRTPDRFDSLFAQSAFGRSPRRHFYEDEGINLFIECTKE